MKRDYNETKRAVVIGIKNKDIKTRADAVKLIIESLDITPDSADRWLDRWGKIFNFKLV